MESGSDGDEEDEEESSSGGSDDDDDDDSDDETDDESDDSAEATTDAEGSSPARRAGGGAREQARSPRRRCGSGTSRRTRSRRRRCASASASTGSVAGERREARPEETQAYGGELGPRSYHASQLPAYKLGRGVADDLVADVLDKIGDDNFKSGPTVAQLHTEYKNWKRSHRALERRLLGASAGGREENEEEDDEEDGGGGGESPGDATDDDGGDGDGDDGDDASDATDLMVDLEEEEGKRITSEAPPQLQSATLAAMMDALLDDLLEAEAAATVAEVGAERTLASAISSRIVLGSIARAASGNKAAAVPAELPKMVTDMGKTMEGFHRHKNNLTVKWRGRRPRKAKHDSDSSSSSDEADSDAEGAGGVRTLPLEEAIDAPRSKLLRRLYVDAEGAYWEGTKVEMSVVPLAGAGAECVDLRFSPNNERTLLACGTRGGGVSVWHLDAGPQLTLLRTQPAVRGSAPNAVRSVRWSHDGTELATSDHSGLTRVWTVAAQMPLLVDLSTQRARTFRQQMLQLDANERLQAQEEGGGVGGGSVGGGGGGGGGEGDVLAAREAAVAAANALALEQDAEREAWEGALGATLGTQKISGGGFSNRPHVVMQVSHEELYHPQLLDSTDEAEAALQASRRGQEDAARSAAPAFTAQAPPAKGAAVADPDKRRQGRNRRSAKDLSELDKPSAAAAAAPPPSPPNKRGSFRFGGRGGSKAVGGADAAASSQSSPRKMAPSSAVVAAAAAAPAPPKAPEREWEALYPVVAEFHPSFTLLGAQPSLMVAMQGGLIAKVNRPGAERVMHSQPLGTPKPLATREEIQAALAELRATNKAAAAAQQQAQQAAPPHQRRRTAAAAVGQDTGGGAAGAGAAGGAPDRGDTSGEAVPASLGSEVLTREYFTGHTSAILLMGFIDNHSYMISLDEAGLLLEWPYKQEHFSSYGWFRPTKMLQLGLTLRMQCRDPSSAKVHFPPAGLAPGGAAAANAKGGRRGGGLFGRGAPRRRRARARARRPPAPTLRSTSARRPPTRTATCSRWRPRTRGACGATTTGV